ncbi:SLC13 family permease [Croceimicrobium hydrocarbonivorans]|uniref:SLC13 family permease n=1 Tax=Croceimicrobium hydrocarbonivorans TaxID=2761580 RepID=A0A7H0VG87_9FLAO|nr:SLC13 family permease [Croceimicrobium hydrocarbonivorans]QNR24735.1 SLC13 family permease [Croceimicrobium hydrocarbonivorans]
MLSPEYHSIASLIIIGLLVLVLITDRFKTSLVFLFGGAALMISGAISAPDFLEGLSNPSIIKIFLLIIITAGINESFDLIGGLNRIFKGVKTPQGFIVRMGSSVAILSAFMNNTPVVSVMIPFVHQWGKSNRISPSKLLIPLSFAAIMGGVITLIGTSTNLLLNGLIQDAGLQPLSFFDFTLPGIGITVLGILAMAILAPKLLGDKEDLVSEIKDNRREYLIELRLIENSQYTGQSVEAVGLRNLEGFFLTQIIRENREIAPVPPSEILRQDDVLLFAGDTGQINNLVNRFPGLELAKTNEFQLIENTSYVEAIVAQNSQMDRRNAKEMGFRQRYDAAIIGIHRRGEKLSGKIGSIDLHVGDVLLMVAGPRFIERSSNTGDLIILEEHHKIAEKSNNSKWAFGIGTALSILLSSFGVLSFLEALLLILALQVATKMVNLDLINRVLSLDLLIILMVSLALGDSLISSGGAQILTDHLFSGANHWDHFTLITIVFITTWLLTSFITNVAAVSIMFPIAYSLAMSSGISYEALFLSTAFGASCSFITPFAYQTNLMVMELGKYRFRDFFRIGSIISLIYVAVFLFYIKVFYL